jgi:hypothetical protein
MGLQAFTMYDRDTSRFFFFLIPFRWLVGFFLWVFYRGRGVVAWLLVLMI